MFFSWKGFVIVMAALAAVAVLCVVDLRCSGGLGPGSSVARVKGELAEGKKAMRQLEADNLAQVARDLRMLAMRYKEKGENRKAQRAIGAAQELDKKIAQLLAEGGDQEGGVSGDVVRP